ncbi:response regulator [Lysobacter sp. CA199]|uniref:response regulator n=1 Tax=Lysobacter sp. CA199 TaxID=3455608 RepID=UPI003F8D5CEA
MKYIVADDQPHTVMVLKSLLVNQLKVDPEQIQAAYDSEELLESISELQLAPAVVILDVALPEAHDRLSMLRAALLRDNKLKIVMYSTNDSPFLVEDAMTAGALGYVCKKSSLLLLSEAVRVARQGIVLIDPAIKMEILPSHPWSKVTQQQRRILIALCQGTPPGEIATEVGVRYDSISRHKRKAIKKLRIKNDIELLAYLHQNGLTYLLDS